MDPAPHINGIRFKAVPTHYAMGYEPRHFIFMIKSENDGRHIMDWGMENRLNRLMPDGKCFFMPIDHGYFQGPTTGLEKPGETIKELLTFVDAVFCTQIG